MTELREDRRVISIHFPGQDKPLVLTDGCIVMEPGNGAMIPWVKYTQDGNTVMVNTSCIQLLILGDDLEGQIPY